jgi:hypothetical protein
VDVLFVYYVLSFTAHRLHSPILIYHCLLLRISQALDICSEIFDEECIAFDKTASAEEERAFLMCNIFSANSDTRGLPLDDIDCQNNDDDTTIRR